MHHARLALRIGQAAMLLTVPLAMVQGIMPDVLLLLPFLASIVVLGLPHGALDHVVLARAWRSAWPWSLLLYVGLAGSYLVAWWIVPHAALALFIALTWLHWGQGDVAALADSGLNGHLRTPLHRALSAVWRGGLPMVVPLVMHPEPYRQTADAVLELFDAGARLPQAVLQPEIRYAIGGLLLLLGGGLAARTYAAARSRGPAVRRAWTNDVGESLLLIAALAVVHPALALGVYFVAWHSLRHVLRLRRTVAHDGAPVAAWPRMVRWAAPTTGLALLGLVLLAWGASADPSRPWQLLAVYLVALAVLTLPHVGVVLLMDRADGLWNRRPTTYEADRPHQST